MLAIVDGTVSPAAEARIPVTDEGLLRGDGVFEVMRLYGGRPFALDEHLARLARSAENLRLPVDLDAVRADVEALLERSRRRPTPRCGSSSRAAAGASRSSSRSAAARRRVALATRRPTRRRACSTASSRSPTPRTCSRRGSRASRAPTRRCWSRRTGACSRRRRRRSSASLDGERSCTPPLDDHILDSITRRARARAVPTSRSAR